MASHAGDIPTRLLQGAVTGRPDVLSKRCGAVPSKLLEHSHKSRKNAVTILHNIKSSCDRPRYSSIVSMQCIRFHLSACRSHDLLSRHLTRHIPHQTLPTSVHHQPLLRYQCRRTFISHVSSVLPAVLVPPVMFLGLGIALWIWKCAMLIVWQKKSFTCLACPQIREENILKIMRGIVSALSGERPRPRVLMEQRLRYVSQQRSHEIVLLTLLYMCSSFKVQALFFCFHIPY